MSEKIVAETTRDALKEALKAAWADPAVLALKEEMLKLVWSNPAVKAARSEVSKEMWSNEEYRVKNTEALKNAKQRNAKPSDRPKREPRLNKKSRKFHPLGKMMGLVRRLSEDDLAFTSSPGVVRAKVSYSYQSDEVQKMFDRIIEHKMPKNK